MAGGELNALEDPRPLLRWRDRLIFMLVAVALLWAVELVDFFTGIINVDLDRHGIIPRTSSGLVGILFAPFLHGGWDHLISNTLPFFVLGCLVMISGIPTYLIVSIVIGLVGGLGTWCFGTGGAHIGASGLIFGYLGYVLTRGIFVRSLPWIGIGIAVGFFYWWMVQGLFRIEEGISWVGHAFGFVGGIVSAWVVGRIERRRSGRVSLDDPTLT